MKSFYDEAKIALKTFGKYNTSYASANLTGLNHQMTHFVNTKLKNNSSMK